MVQVDLRGLIRLERERRKQQAQQASTSQRSEAAQEQADLELLRRTASGPPRDYWRHCSVGSDVVKGLLYVPDFLNAEEAAAVVRWIEATPAGRWVAAGERRMQNWGGRPGAAAVQEALPPLLRCLVDRLVAGGLYSAEHAPNHVLINEYAGGAGIPAHQDGPLYLDRVAIITLEGPALLHLHQPDTLQTLATVLLTPRCLFVADGPAYSACLHSIPSQASDRITPACCNAAAAGVQPGSNVSRARRRLSLVFVHKLQT